MTCEEAVRARLGGFRISEAEGDIFEAPEDSILIHAVNCQGEWGSGIAAAFKSKYPVAFGVYKSHCKEKPKLPGTCLLIPPQIKDYKSSLPVEDGSGQKRKRGKGDKKPPSKKHWIGCLFTSFSYGKPTKFKAGKDSPEKILSNTMAALEDLREQVEALDAGQPALVQLGFVESGNDMGEISGKGTDSERTAGEEPNGVEARLDANLGPLYACKFNSGSFGVDWKDTTALIEEVFDGSSKTMHVVSPPPQKR